MILKQQKLIKKLLRRKRGSSNDILDTNQGTGSSGGNGNGNKPEEENLNDSSDPAIAGEVSLMVPILPLNLLSGTSAAASATASTASTAPPTVEEPLSEDKTIINGNRKAKEERQRISNRQKLLLLKRHHSGYLKRPEILETVYSVEEDTDNVQQQPQQAMTSAASAASLNKITRHVPPLPKTSTETTSTANSTPLTSLRRRLDSDLTTNSDCSTDLEFYSESETTACSCSQSCSRRSSCGFLCRCPQCGMMTASAPTSRRSSCGSMMGQVFQRVMTNHRGRTNSEEMRFRRINKAKSRSLGELRGKLTLSSSTNDEDLEDFDDEDEQSSSGGGGKGTLGPRLTGGVGGGLGVGGHDMARRLTMLRSVGQQRSLSLDQESTATEGSTN